jgi:hypothetical protein
VPAGAPAAALTFAVGRKPGKISANEIVAAVADALLLPLKLKNTVSPIRSNFGGPPTKQGTPFAAASMIGADASSDNGVSPKRVTVIEVAVTAVINPLIPPIKIGAPISHHKVCSSGTVTLPPTAGTVIAAVEGANEA